MTAEVPWISPPSGIDMGTENATGNAGRQQPGVMIDRHFGPDRSVDRSHFGGVNGAGNAADLGQSKLGGRMNKAGVKVQSRQNSMTVAIIRNGDISSDGLDKTIPEQDRALDRIAADRMYRGFRSGQSDPHWLPETSSSENRARAISLFSMENTVFIVIQF